MKTKKPGTAKVMAKSEYKKGGSTKKKKKRSKKKKY